MPFSATLNDLVNTTIKSALNDSKLDSGKLHKMRRSMRVNNYLHLYSQCDIYKCNADEMRRAICFVLHVMLKLH